MWIPTWLGECYSRLYMRFGQELFTFSEAKELLSFSSNKLSVAFSKLHSKRILLIFDRRKPRLYRLLDPENFILLSSGIVKNVERIGSERYLKLILDCLRTILKTMDIESFAVYGSVARGTASNHSEVNILLISDSLEGSLASRLDKLYHLEKSLESELTWLKGHGIYASLNFYPLRINEARRLPLLLLDLTEEAATLYDKNNLLETILVELRDKLLKQGAKRVKPDGGKRCWDLMPGRGQDEKIAAT